MGVSRRGFITSMGAGVVGTAALGAPPVEAAPPAVLAADETATLALQRQRGRATGVRGAAHDAPRGAARAPRAHRHQARLRARRVRRLHGAARRRAPLRLPDARARGRGRTRSRRSRGCSTARRSGRPAGVRRARTRFQCGYCTPGQVMAVEGLLRRDAGPDARRDPRGRERQPLPLRRLRPHLQGRGQRAAELQARRGEVSHDRDPARTLGARRRSSASRGRASTPTSASAARPSTRRTSSCPTCSTPPSSAARTPTRA